MKQHYILLLFIPLFIGCSLAEIDFMRAVKKAENGNFEEAISLFNRIIESDREIPDELVLMATQMRGHTYGHMFHVTHDSTCLYSAIDDLSVYLSVHPDGIDAVRKSGMIYKDLGDFERAAIDYRHLVELEPSNWVNVSRLARLLRFNLDQKERAIDVLDSALLRQPDDIELLLLRAQFNTHDRNFSGAEEDINRIFELDPNSYRAICAQGGVHVFSQHWEEAVAEYTRAIEVDSTHWVAYYQRANILRYLGRTEEAEADSIRGHYLRYGDE